MSDLLEVGQKWLGGKLRDHASQSVTYKRDSDEAQLQATIGKSTYEQHDGEGVVIKSQVLDFLIDIQMLHLDEFLYILFSDLRTLTVSRLVILVS